MIEKRVLLNYTMVMGTLPEDFHIGLSNLPPDKLEEFVLFVIEASSEDSSFAGTKLNKLVWLADFQAFCETGSTISGASYQKEKFGPIPRAMPIVLERLEREGRVKVKRVPMGGKTGKRPVALGKPNLSAFSPDQIAIAAKVIAENFHKNGSQMSHESHEHIAYKVAKMGETIPFSAWLVKKPRRTADSVAFARNLRQRVSKN